MRPSNCNSESILHTSLLTPQCCSDRLQPPVKAPAHYADLVCIDVLEAVLCLLVCHLPGVNASKYWPLALRIG